MGDEGDGSAAGLTSFLVNAHDFWNDLAALFNIQHIALVDVELLDDIGIMQRCALDYGAAQQHGVKIGDRRDDAGAAHLKRHELQLGAFSLGCEFVGDGPAWRFGSGAQVELLAQRVYFEHESVGGDRQRFALHVPVIDEVFHCVDAGQDGHHTGLEAPAFERRQAFIVCLERQVVAQQEVEYRIQATTSDFGTVLQLERTGSGVAGVGEQRFLIELALLVEFLETLPRQHDLATHLKLVGQVFDTSDLKGDALDGDDVGRHIVALHTVAARHGTHQPPVLIGHRNRGAVIFHLAHDLTGFAAQTVLGAAQEVLNLLDAVAVRQRHHRSLVSHLREPLADVAAHALGG